MASRPDLPCAGCGRLMWRAKGSLPEGEAKCRDCRRGPTEATKGAKAATAKSKVASKAKPRSLRAVRTGEKPPPKPPPPPDDQDDDKEDEDPIMAQRTRLVAIRRRVMNVIDNPGTAARDLAALINRELELTEKIHQIDMTIGTSTSVVAKTSNDTWDQSAI